MLALTNHSAINSSLGRRRQFIFNVKFTTKLIDLKTWYCREYRDSMMASPPSWFKSLIICEVIQFPFFFFGVYGFFKGAKQCRWLRWPCVVYGVHVATTLVPIIGYVLLEDFSKATLPSPRNMTERLTLLGFYSPYLVIPILIALDALFSSAYTDYRAASNQKPRDKKIK
ncbi:sigma intracellular receptor 2-like isoform X2 [Biomphalaria glabrata]|uniref:Sigma intracellular receptor 2-like isoform X2 n=1 Tax=Biomphalaria glabrata TaxID=6526 RepID=A0A9U8EK56_BIOGL|nr:sigma intracellular receptor 2-like isoform X2 [Biomphalaria glabrata]